MFRIKNKVYYLDKKNYLLGSGIISIFLTLGFIYGFYLFDDVRSGILWGLGFSIVFMGHIYFRLQEKLIVNEKDMTVKTLFRTRTISLKDISYVTLKKIKVGRGRTTDMVCFFDKENKEILSFESDLLLNKKQGCNTTEFFRFIQSESQAKISPSIELSYKIDVSRVELDDEIPIVTKTHPFLVSIFLLAASIFVYLIILYLLTFIQ